MAANNENLDRRVVPRWRTFREALATNELSASTVAKTPIVDGTPFLREKESQWLANKDLVFAIDLVGAATFLGESAPAKSAAEFILEIGAVASPSARHLAHRLLGTAEEREDKYRHVTRIQIIESLKSLKARRLSQTSNAFVWSDLARLYVLLGQIEPARHAMRVALSLAPTERFVVRCATRFFLHSKDHDQALHLLRSNPRTAFDPWLTAAEIAVSSVMDKTPKFAKRGFDLLKNSNIPPFHLSELASALGSLEMFGGNNRKANKLFIASLEQPTDNSLAQVVWASKRTGIGEVNQEFLSAAPCASEAKAFDAYNRAVWENVIIYAENWAREESFSARPRQLASAIAASLLDEPALGDQIAKEGLTTNPGHPGLINNIAFSLIHQNKPQEALIAINKVDKRLVNPFDAICLVATAGLAYFRLGNAVEGREHYEAAIEAASRAHNHTLKTLARLYLSRELVLQKDPDGLKEFRKAHDEAMKLQDTNLPHVAAHLAKKVMDSEVSIKPSGNNLVLKASV